MNVLMCVCSMVVVWSLLLVLIVLSIGMWDSVIFVRSCMCLISVIVVRRLMCSERHSFCSV